MDLAQRITPEALKQLLRSVVENNVSRPHAVVDELVQQAQGRRIVSCLEWDEEYENECDYLDTLPGGRQGANPDMSHVFSVVDFLDSDTYADIVDEEADD